MIQLRVAGERDTELYRNFFNMYHNDLAQYSDDFTQVDEEGYYDKEAVECYFKQDEHITPYVITYNKKAVGILVLSQVPYVKPGCDYCIQELFILGAFRRKHVAEEACMQIINQFKGQYCIAVLKQNRIARKFWEKLIAKHMMKLREDDLDEKSIVIEFINGCES